MHFAFRSQRFHAAPRRFRSFAGLLLVWLCLALPAAALNPKYRAGEYAIQTWQTEDGLPAGRVHALLQSQDGYMWAGTSQGLARFDGHRFVLYDSSVYPELTNPLYYAVAQTPDGALWLGANGGLFRLHRGELKRFTEADGMITNSIRTLAVARDGRLYVGATRGRSFFIEGDRATLQEGPWKEVSNSVRSYLDRGNGVHLVGTVSGFWQISGDKVEKLSDRPEFPASEVQALAESPDGTLWIGSNIGVRRIRPDGSVRDFGVEQGLENPHVQSLFLDRDGNLWIGTSGGLFRMRGNRVEAARYPNRIGTATIFNMCEDREGALWIGSSAGLFRLKNAPFHSIGPSEGLENASAYAVCESRDGSLWIGTMGGGVYHYDEVNGAVPLRAPPEMNLDLVYSVHEEPDGALWIGAHAGFARYKDGVFTDFYERRDDIAEIRKEFLEKGAAMLLPKVIHARITSIISDGDGGLWIGANGALYHYRDGQFRGYTERDGMPHDAHTIRSVFRASNGDIWATTTGGTARYRDGKFTVYTTDDGLTHNNTRSIYEGSDGTIWISTESGGLNRFKDGVWHGYTQRDGLFDDTCGGMLEDDAGFLWMGSTRGIMRTALKDFDDFDAKRIPLLRPRLFTRHDGMPSSACNLEGSPNGLKARGGVLLYPTARGIAAVDPDDVTLNTVTAPVYVENIVVNGKESDLSHAVVIPPGDNDLQIQYTAISLLAPEKVRFKYRLSPVDKDWSEVTDDREINYAKLPPDDYVFHVIACNSDGIWNEQGTSLAFTVRPFFHQTAWFRTVALFSIFAVGLVSYRYRVRRIRRRSEELQRLNVELERRISERTAELAHSNESLRASEYFYHSLVESLPQIIVRKDVDGRFTYANPAFAELVGAPPETIIGRSDHDVYPASVAAKLRADDVRVMETRQPMEYQSVVEKDGAQKRYLHVKKVPLYDQQNRPIGVQMLYWDMTVFRETEEKLKEAQRDLIEISRLAGMAEIAGSVLHNIGNVLTSVNTSAALAVERVSQLRVALVGKVAQLLAEQGDNIADFFANDPRSQKVPSYLSQLAVQLQNERDEALQELQALTAHIEQIKEIVAAQENYARVAGPSEVVPASELVEFALGICAGSLTRHRIAANREFMPAPPVRVQRQKALQIVVSLIRNAKDAIKEQGVAQKELTVGVRVSPQGNVQISVTDNGTGIDPENLTRIFAFGFTTKEFGQGFALHTSALVAKELGGSLTARSEGLGKGATFILELPPADKSPLSDTEPAQG